MLAIIKTGGKQYKVQKGDKIKFEKIPGKAGKAIKFKDVLLVADKSTKIGQPVLKTAEVSGKIVEQGRLRKVRVFKYKNKTGYRRTYGHRQPFTRVEITGIEI